VSQASAVATAATFVWLGMVLAISFLEAPLKFRAPGVTVRIGLGIGRLVFRALNSAEAVLAAVVLAACAVAPARAAAAAAVAVAVLAAQLVVIRPRLSRRSARILAGEEAPRSRAHVAYIVGEPAKVLALWGSRMLHMALTSGDW
jgi:hypothetical protein